MENKLKFIQIIEEATRCLLCYDPPCNKVCPGKKAPADVIMSLKFKNYKGACYKSMENLNLVGECGVVCNNNMYCQKNCIRGKIDRPIKIKMIQEFLYKDDLKLEEVK